MPRYKVGDTVLIEGRKAKVIWLSENASEVEAFDEYIVEFEDRGRKFLVSGELDPQQTQSMHDRKHDGDPCHRQTY